MNLIRPTPRLIALTAALAVLVAGQTAPAADAPNPRDAAALNRLIGRGINFGNALDAPSEGEWGLTLEPAYFAAVARAGFDSVRIPIRWAPHAGPAPDFRIEPAYFERVDWALDQALKHGLTAIINIHHDEASENEPARYLPRAIAFWNQIAARYQDRPDRLVFELLNEPHGPMTDANWQASFPSLLAAIRATNPTRAVIVGPGHWNGIDSLDKLTLPEGDRHLIVTFHYYSPFHFTHQGAEWSEGSQAWLGETWTATPDQLATLNRDLGKAADWGQAHDRPLFLGEFGAYSKAPMPSRVIWTNAVARAAEARGISWSYWEFGSGFGAYDPHAHAWRQPLLEALIPPAR